MTVPVGTLRVYEGRYVVKTESGYRRRARVVMEEHLGRALERNEVVHHINGDRGDDRIENLELMSLAEHSRMHNKGKPITEKQRAALATGTEAAREVNIGNKYRAGQPRAQWEKDKISDGLRRAYQEGRR